MEIPNSTPQFKETLNIWRHVKNDELTELKDLYQQIIWYNKLIMIKGKTVYCQHLFACGIWTISDLYCDGKLIPYDVWLKRGALPKDYILWRGIIHSLPANIKYLAKDINEATSGNNRHNTTIKLANNSVKQIGKCSQKDIKAILRCEKFSNLKDNDFKAKIKYSNLLNGIQNETWQNIFILLINLHCNNKICEMQFKILHRIIGVNNFLFKIRKVDSPRCDYCEIYNETIEHLFFDCFSVKTFWLNLIESWNNFSGSQYSISKKDALLGYNLDDPMQYPVVNLLILYGKKYIFICKKSQSILDINSFKKYVIVFYAYLSKLRPFENKLIEFCI